MKTLSSKSVAFISVFAAFHVILYVISPPILWRNWAIYLAPIEAVILGPWAGFLAATIGSTIGRIVLPTPLWMFGIISEPLSVIAAGFLIQKTWKPVLGIYGIIFAVYFISPLGRELPVWPLVDAIVAFCLIYPAAKLSRNLFTEDVKLLPVSFAIISFITVATDGFARVFLFIPAELYRVLGLTQDMVSPIFIGGAIDSFIEDSLVIFVSLVAGIPILLALRKILSMRNFETRKEVTKHL